MSSLLNVEMPMIKAMSMVKCIGCFFLNICPIINILVEFQKFKNIKLH